MAVRQMILYIFAAFFFNEMEYTLAMEFNLPKIDGNLTMRSHLEHENIQNHCKRRNETCTSNETNICAVKVVNNERFYKDFLNSCFLFMSNMCDHPEEEYFIISSGSCKEFFATKPLDEDEGTTVNARQSTTPGINGASENFGPTVTETKGTTEGPGDKGTVKKGYNSATRTSSTARILRMFASRRLEDDETATEAGETTTDGEEATVNNEEVTETESAATTADDGTTKKAHENTTRRHGTGPALRAFSYSRLYEVEYSHDGHVCPHSCTSHYLPVCVNVNKWEGKHFRLYLFLNHCISDKYYCMHWRDFQPIKSPTTTVADEDEDSHIVMSHLGWSFCGSHRYIQFARFSEVLSTMNSYGWLSGNYRYSQILRPGQIKPGFG
ncbi:uncharacterized protein LOC113508917 [Trichoplusia ni]|uniref:Uncharacterized protein LOC113508917 n=1 Tax=Trichoplusia ni TaxID=7111 RepID=A0A7E5X5U4_TRINI|nr:uncharacterized protein LOC113508917 [Trichoplusia ni]